MSRRLGRETAPRYLSGAQFPIQSHPMKTLPALFLLLFGAMTLLSACNTVEGVGEDVKSVGRAMKRAVN